MAFDNWIRRLKLSPSVCSHRHTPNFIATFFVFLLLSSHIQACGPAGRGYGRRRTPRKMTPLVVKQHVPNVSENTLQASGPADGKIKRGTRRFRELTVNYNPDIIFKDEEGTGADRIMSLRCKDKLNTLAITVMNQWKGVKLRVTESWDEDYIHARNSLHYEGRAVDITTSDRDRSKYGMLARLAYEAGFDWVYYESRGHVHASVKSDSALGYRGYGCFPGNSFVIVEGQGRTAMSHLQQYDRVLTADKDGILTYSDVILFLHKQARVKQTFVTIQTQRAKSIRLTETHLLFVQRGDRRYVVYARDIATGDLLYTLESNALEPTLVTNISRTVLLGNYAPLTTEGTIIVDDVYVSSYAVVNSHVVAHAAMAPVRWLHSLMTAWVPRVFKTKEAEIRTIANNDVTLDSDTEGIHWYPALLHFLVNFFSPSLVIA